MRRSLRVASTTNASCGRIAFTSTKSEWSKLATKSFSSTSHFAPSSAERTNLFARSFDHYGHKRTYSSDKFQGFKLPELPLSPEQMMEEMKLLGKLTATVKKRKKEGDEGSPGVSVTVAGNGRLDKVNIDDDLAGDVASIEKLIVEAYMEARVAVFDSMKAITTEKLRREKEKAV